MNVKKGKKDGGRMNVYMIVFVFVFCFLFLFLLSGDDVFPHPDPGRFQVCILSLTRFTIFPFLM